MKQFAEFVLHHPWLFIALAAVIALLLVSELRRRLLGLPSLSPVQATQLINHQDAVLLDVREPAEYPEGLLPNSLRIPLGALAGKVQTLEKYRDHPIILFCRSGHRSALAARLLRQQGFTALYNLGGGMQAWRSANLPIQKK